jgi:diadenosine tetraphosphate (Ap4A) HIT family hydrolase
MTAPGKQSAACPFCEILAGRAPASITREWPQALAIKPRHPVTPGHTLIISREHAPDAGTDPAVSASAMAAAAELAGELPAANIITSRGADATQTVRHLHLHVVPRTAGDGLALPWTGQDRPGPVRVAYAREPLPARGTSVFLAGPTPRSADVPSWRPDAITELARQWNGPGPLTVLSPESRGGKRAEHYDDQVSWETRARASADSILFWIPRDLKTMPAMTTNVEFGLDVTTGRAVLGCPPGCANPERNRYLIWVARQHGVPVRETLPDTAAAAIAVTQPASVAGTGRGAAGEEA